MKKGGNRHPQRRIFRCEECGETVTAPKWKGRTGPGHVKFMYCIRCKMLTTHVQTGEE